MRTPVFPTGSFPVALILVLATANTGFGQTQKNQTKPLAIAFEHVNVIAMDREVVLPDQTVLVEGDKIRAVGTTSTTKIPKDARRIDGRGKFLIPGLTDAHVHLQTPLEFPVFLANGVTTVYNLDGHPAHLRWREEIARGERVGPAIFTTGPIFRQSHTAEAAVRMVDEQAALGYDGVKIYNGVSKEEYPALIAESKKKKLLLMGHVARTPDFELTLASGQSIAHLEEYTYTFFNPKRDDDDSHIIYDQARIPEAVQLTVKSGIYVTPTLANYAMIVQQATALDEFLKNPNLRYDAPWIQDAFQPDADRYRNGFEPSAYPRIRESLALQRKLVKALSDAGVPLMCGTDASGVGPVAGFGVHEELQEFVSDGISPYHALQTATVNPARYFGKSDEFGTIEPGKRADLLLLSGSPLADIRNTTKIAGLMIRGRWLDQNQLHAALEKVPESYAQAIQEVSRRLEREPESASKLLEHDDPYGQLAATALSAMSKDRSTEELTAMLQGLRKRLAGSLLVSEDAFNSLGYRLLGRKEFPASMAVLRLNTEDFPKSANTWDSLADAQFQSGDVVHAVENYSKALEVDPKYGNADFARKFLAKQRAAKN